VALRCANEVAGTVTEQGNPVAVVQATFVDSTGRGMAKLRASPYVLDDTLKQEALRIVATIWIDAHGTARFDAPSG
jgi:hypothetical protein